MNGTALSDSAGRPDFTRLRRIAVFRALQLGDLLCAVPALRALRRAAPAAEITLIGLPWAADFAQRYAAYLDGFLAFPGFPGMPERQPDLAQLPIFLKDAQACRFDFALQLHGSGELSNPLTVALGAGRNGGFMRPGQYCPDPRTFIDWLDAEHEVRRCLRLCDRLGIATQGEALAFPVQDADRAALHRALPELPPAGSLVCIHPGARWPSRRWPASRFAALADGLAGDGCTIVLTGTREEQPLTQAVSRAMRAPVINAAGRTSLGAMAALLATARLLVANDTGVSHLAAALGMTSLIVCCGSDPRRWAPLDRRRHRVMQADVDCRPCGFRDCPIGHPCATGMPVNRVLAAARAQLALSGQEAR